MITTINLTSQPEVETVFSDHPKEISDKLRQLRQFILETASEIEDLHELEETLKWGEPSYLAKKGSTIRLNRRKSSPSEYAIYFKCTSKLVPTFRLIYPDVFTFEKNRAIVFDIKDEIPVVELKHCISLALRYHKVKHLPRLGA